MTLPKPKRKLLEIVNTIYYSYIRSSFEQLIAPTEEEGKPMFKRPAAFAVGIAVAALVAACSSGSNSTTANSAAQAGGSSASSHGPINVLTILDTSGPDKAVGSQELLGVRAAAAYYNANGGILGRKIVVTEEDDNNDATTAVDLAVQALSGSPGKYSLVVPGEEGTITAALIPIMARYNVYAVDPTDGKALCVNVSTCPTEFSTTPNDSVATLPLAKFFKNKGITNVGIIGEQIDFTQTEVPYLQADLKNLGIKSEAVSFPSGAVNVTPEMSQLKSEGAQAVYAAALGPAVGYVLSGRAGLGWSAPVAFDLAGSASNIPTLASASELSNVYLSASYCMNSANSIPGFNNLFKYASAPVNGTLPCQLVGAGWSAVVMLHDAAVKANSLATSALVKATESMNQSAGSSQFIPYAQLCFTATDHELCPQSDDIQIVPVGSIVKTRLVPVGSSS
ncbi:MAG: ABC transporter substrate-binding protein [Acidimicrobiales bacterium]